MHKDAVRAHKDAARQGGAWGAPSPPFCRRLCQWLRRLPCSLPPFLGCSSSLLILAGCPPLCAWAYRAARAPFRSPSLHSVARKAQAAALRRVLRRSALTLAPAVSRAAALLAAESRRQCRAKTHPTPHPAGLHLYAPGLHLYAPSGCALGCIFMRPRLHLYAAALSGRAVSRQRVSQPFGVHEDCIFMRPRTPSVPPPYRRRWRRPRKSQHFTPKSPDVGRL